MTKINKKIEIKGVEVAFTQTQQEDFISITDIAKYKNSDAPADIIKNWLRSKNTIELLGLWEKLHNPNFKLVEFDQFRDQAGYNHFVLSPKKWITTTNKENIDYDLYRSAVIKEFEIILEQSGKLLKKCLNPYFHSSKEADKLVYKDIFRHAGHHSLLAIAKETLSSNVGIWVYGSRINGKAHNTSDLDLVLKSKEEDPLSISELMDFEEAIQESNIPILVQILDWSRIPDTFKKNILHNYEVLR